MLTGRVPIERPSIHRSMPEIRRTYDLKKGSSDVCRAARLQATRDKFRDMVICSFRFSIARFNVVPILIQRPEGVTEQIFGVVPSFEFDESVPIITKTAFGCF